MDPQVHAQASMPSAPPQPILSDAVIPAVRGEFYSYSTDFSIERPLCFLMKCKANKDRPLIDAEPYTNELDLTFIFGNVVQVCAPNAEPSVRLLRNTSLPFSF